MLIRPYRLAPLCITECFAPGQAVASTSGPAGPDLLAASASSLGPPR